MNDDSMLRQRFAWLRQAEHSRAPRFEQVVGRARRRPNPGLRRLTAAACVVLAAVTVTIVRVSQLRRPLTIPAAAPPLVDWHVPTDFLLDTPGRELLHTIPDIGRYPTTGLGPFPPTRTNTPAPRAGREHS